ncbi:MAG: polysaccharide pyruvyl transferase family protein [Lachnospiraceae bacterium]|nr:polysaccharide pyruvyl transferase family protein [Lachnospiraceae bacterium]
MKKKVGLIPLLYDEYNYGGILQFYALQRTIKNLGYDFEIVKVPDGGLVCSPMRNQTWKSIILRCIKPLLDISEKKNQRIIKRNIEKRIDKINIFKNKYYGEYVNKTGNNDCMQYDAIICGSDQIWNPKWAKKRTMLTFVPDEVNKVIYAASIGCEEMSDDEKEAFKPLIERIQHISVREFSAKKLLNSFIVDKDIQVVLDPTLLLSPDEWKQLEVTPKTRGYILTYFLGEYGQYHLFIKQLADTYQLHIINILFASGERVDNEAFGDRQIVDASPEEFIGLISNAEAVFTDSFHACVFSTLFHRRFYVFERKSSSNMVGRIMTLQEHFNLGNRIITLNSKVDLTESIDFSHNDEYQRRLAEASLTYLRESIENE